MLKAAEMARPLGGVLALLCAFAAGAAKAEPLRPALKPPAPAALIGTIPVAVEEPSTAEAVASIAFQPTRLELSEPAQRDFAAMAATLRARPAARVAVIAHAGAAGEAMSARRISLGRALAVRGYLIGEGVARGRIIVRALGAPADGGAPERVDIRWLAQ
jgi:outer membrane protein OmpA-like peptidoglycan-associated protein